MEELLNAIVERLDEEFKDHTKYLYKTVEGFDRPSFFIYVVSNKQTEVNKSIYNQNITIRILYNDYLDIPNRLRQTQVGEKLLDIFSPISLRVNNREIKIAESILGFTDEDEIYLQITFDKYKNKIELNEGYELMEGIILDA